MMTLLVTYQGFNPCFDAELQSVVGLELAASGYGGWHHTPLGVRDLIWVGDQAKIKRAHHSVCSLMRSNKRMQNKIIQAIAYVEED